MVTCNLTIGSNRATATSVFFSVHLMPGNDVHVAGFDYRCVFNKTSAISPKEWHITV